MLCSLGIDAVLISVVESAKRSCITVGVELLHSFNLAVAVRPLELQLNAVRVGNTQHFHGDCDHHLVFLCAVVNLAHNLKGVSTVRAVVARYGGGEFVLCAVVDNVIIAVPAGVGIAIHVQKQLHPGGVVVKHSDILAGFRVEVNVFGVCRYLGGENIVSARGVGVFDSAKSVSVTVQHIVCGVGVGHKHLFPNVKRACNVDSVACVLHDHGSCALESLDIIGDLHVVVVKVAALHHFGITREFGGSAVHKADLTGIILSLRDPFVPARNQYVRNVSLNGSVPLGLEVGTLHECVGILVKQLEVVGTRFCVIDLSGKGSAKVGFITVKCGIGEASRAKMLRNGYIDRTGLTVCVVIDVLRPLKIHPGPAVFLHVLGGPLIELNGKEIVDVCLVGSNDSGLAVDHVPGIGVMTGGVDLVVDLLDADHGIGIGVEHDLGSVVALLVKFVQNCHELECNARVGGKVGGVKI